MYTYLPGWLGSLLFSIMSWHTQGKDHINTGHDSIYMNVIILDTSLHLAISCYITLYIVALLYSQNFYHCHALTDKYELKLKPAQFVEWYIMHDHISYISTYDYMEYLSWLCTCQLS